MSTGTQVEVVMPQMGVSVSEGTITRWLKQPGDSIALDEPLLEISTDKVDTEVPSPGEGVVAEIRVQEGETVEVGTVLAVDRPRGRRRPPSQKARRSRRRPRPWRRPRPPRSPSPSRRRRARRRLPVAPPPSEPTPQPVAAAPVAETPAPPEGSGNGRTFISPVVARIAAEHGVDPGAIAGTGQGGRVTKKDILAFIESGAAAAAHPPAPEAPPRPPHPPRRGARGARCRTALRRASGARRRAPPTTPLPPAPRRSAPLPCRRPAPVASGHGRRCRARASTRSR